jgi:hypothetical protein
MEDHGCLAINSEMTIFMRREGEECITGMHGLFVDDMIHAVMNDNLRDQFIRAYKADFNITLEDVMASFIGIEIEHNKKDIAIHLDTYMRETLDEYKMAVSKILKPKKVQPGVMLEQEDSPETPDRVKQMVYRSFVAKLQFGASWIRCDIAFTASQLARFCASAKFSGTVALVSSPSCDG